MVLGWDSASASRVEGARARLKWLVERGRLVEHEPGRFTPPAPGCRAAAHEHGHRPQDDGFAGVGAPLVVPDQAPVARAPGEGSFHDPAAGQDLEAAGVVAAADDAGGSAERCRAPIDEMR
ncbi:hypothetical protein [Streptomyces sp. NPDC058766]|uniref:hypothetical protein n=1 Tax=Streptomyces sp. NPDC058766 TaxID=3346630 RepID=UPI003692480E